MIAFYLDRLGVGGEEISVCGCLQFVFGGVLLLQLLNIVCFRIRDRRVQAVGLTICDIDFNDLVACFLGAAFVVISSFIRGKVLFSLVFSIVATGILGVS